MHELDVVVAMRAAANNLRSMRADVIREKVEAIIYDSKQNHW
jgi:hypothetical protein